jgi:hypothetical protein
MSLIEERLRFQQLEPTGRLNGVQQQPLPPRPNERAPSYRSPRSTPMRGEKGYQQWQDYKKQQIRPTYLGNNDPYAQLTATMTDQPTNRLPYAPRRPQTLNFTPRPPQNNPVRQPNPLFCSPHQAAMAAQGRASKSVAPRLSFNPITQDPSSMCPPGVVPDARILKLVALRTQDWSMFTPTNPTGGANSSSGYGKAAMRPCGGGSSAVGLISGSNNMNIGFTGQSERDYNTRSERMKRWRAGEGVPNTRRLGGMQSTGMMSIMGLPDPAAKGLHARRVGQTSVHSPRSRFNGGVNPITGRAYDPSVEASRNKAAQQLRHRNLQRDTTGEKNREDAGSLLTGRAGMEPNWLPASKRVTHVQRTQFPPAANRTPHFTASKRVYAQANRASDWHSGPAVVPRSGAMYKPVDRGGGVIFGGGGQQRNSNVLKSSQAGKLGGSFASANSSRF